MTISAPKVPQLTVIVRQCLSCAVLLTISQFLTMFDTLADMELIRQEQRYLRKDIERISRELSSLRNRPVRKGTVKGESRTTELDTTDGQTSHYLIITNSSDHVNNFL